MGELESGAVCLIPEFKINKIKFHFSVGQISEHPERLRLVNVMTVVNTPIVCFGLIAIYQ